jgi:glycine cleavage system aminomethyltransferase T
MAAKKTPLYRVHERSGAKIVDFHGWLMPVQYRGVIQEHEFVRKSAGLFDVCHMGEFMVSGPKAIEFVDRLVYEPLGEKSMGNLEPWNTDVSAWDKTRLELGEAIAKKV